jgi:hypothetical protein
MTSVVSWEHVAGVQGTALQSTGLIRGMHVEAWEKEAILFDCKGCGSDCGYGRLGALEALYVRLPVCIERGVCRPRRNEPKSGKAQAEGTDEENRHQRQQTQRFGLRDLERSGT